MRNCIFCRKTAGLLCENEAAKAFYDNFPVNEGHTLVVPKRHIATIFEAEEQELAAMNALLFRVKEILDDKFRPDGYNIGINVGEAAGQSIFHLHIHVIPRYRGDVKDPRGGVRRVKKSVAGYPLEEEEEKIYNKLVRDRIPELVREEGKIPLWRTAGEEEYRLLLREKLWEEVREFVHTGKEEELADILEVVRALAERQGVGMEELTALAAEKRRQRGGFKRRIVLEKVMEKDGK